MSKLHDIKLWNLENINFLEMRDIIIEIRNCFKHQVRLIEERMCKLEDRLTVIIKNAM